MNSGQRTKVSGQWTVDSGRVEKSGLGFRKLNHDVAVVPRNSSVICQRLIVFWIKEG